MSKMVTRKLKPQGLDSHQCHVTKFLGMQYLQIPKLVMKPAQTKVNYYELKSMVDKVIPVMTVIVAVHNSKGTGMTQFE